ncbi:hypothetical protein [Microbacterium xylanilyticum]
MFPGYTAEVILDLEYEMWVILALEYDEYVAENRKQRSAMSRR